MNGVGFEKVARTSVPKLPLSYPFPPPPPLRTATLRVGGGGQGLLRGNFGMGCASQYFKTYPIHIPGLRKNGPIHILDHPKC